jgi:amino acid transporter
MVGVLKRGISRCLIVMVSLGWGVVRDDLGPVLRKINALGALYIATSLVCDIFTVVAYTEVQRISQEEEEELFDVVSILRIVIAVIDITFYIWIIDSLNATMDHLEGTGQTSKLQRYLRLRCIFLFSILFAVVWSVFGIVNNFDEGIVENEQNWVIDASTELNYIFVLLGVAVLWRPSPTAKEYAYVMELPAMTSDDDDEDGVLDMSHVVPSAADDDEDEIMFEDEPPK